MARTTSHGACELCGYKSSKAGITRHLKSCAAEHDQGKGKPARLLHLRVEGVELPIFWLDVEVKSSSSLHDLDAFLRDIWLECCGHLSMFKIGNVRYPIEYDFEDYEPQDNADLDELREGVPAAVADKIRARTFSERSMDTPVAEALEVGTTFEHEYDYGSSTYLKGKVVGEREGRIGREPLRLLARNDPPEWTCQVCGERARWIHTEELWDSENPFYCQAHKEASGADDYLFLPVVNSPRMGVCGYEG